MAIKEIYRHGRETIPQNPVDSDSLTQPKTLRDIAEIGYAASFHSRDIMHQKDHLDALKEDIKNLPFEVSAEDKAFVDTCLWLFITYHDLWKMGKLHPDSPIWFIYDQVFEGIFSARIFMREIKKLKRPLNRQEKEIVDVVYEAIVTHASLYPLKVITKIKNLLNPSRKDTLKNKIIHFAHAADKLHEFNSARLKTAFQLSQDYFLLTDNTLAYQVTQLYAWIYSKLNFKNPDWLRKKLDGYLPEFTSTLRNERIRRQNKQKKMVKLNSIQ